MTATLRLILGDQLSPGISSLSDLDRDNDVVVMAELWDEATYVKHHKKKIAFLFSAMRHFADELRGDGVTVDYRRLGGTDEPSSFTQAVAAAIERHRPCPARGDGARRVAGARDNARLAGALRLQRGDPRRRPLPVLA